MILFPIDVLFHGVKISWSAFISLELGEGGLKASHLIVFFYIEILDLYWLLWNYFHFAKKKNTSGSRFRPDVHLHFMLFSLYHLGKAKFEKVVYVAIVELIVIYNIAESGNILSFLFTVL